MPASQNQNLTKQHFDKLKAELINLVEERIAIYLKPPEQPQEMQEELLERKLAALEKKAAIMEQVSLRNHEDIEKVISLVEIVSLRMDEIAKKGDIFEKLEVIAETQKSILRLLEKIDNENLMLKKMYESNEELNDWRWYRN
ncbi:hypothetical protein JXJ21_05450 [candidate division KSB1 bacterium]|nr:hypothetical protein [candidate division KSB1 bacterium]